MRSSKQRDLRVIERGATDTGRGGSPPYRPISSVVASSQTIRLDVQNECVLTSAMPPPYHSLITRCEGSQVWTATFRRACAAVQTRLNCSVGRELLQTWRRQRCRRAVGGFVWHHDHFSSNLTKRPLVSCRGNDCCDGCTCMHRGRLVCIVADRGVRGRFAEGSQ
jgi:hypothetical protein